MTSAEDYIVNARSWVEFKEIEGPVCVGCLFLNETYTDCALYHSDGVDETKSFSIGGTDFGFEAYSFHAGEQMYVTKLISSLANSLSMLQ